MVEKISKAHRRLSKIKIDILMTYDDLMMFDVEYITIIDLSI